MEVETDTLIYVHFITILDGHLQTHNVQLTMAESDAQKLHRDLDVHDLLTAPMNCKSVSLAHITSMLKNIVGKDNVYIFKVTYR